MRKQNPLTIDKFNQIVAALGDAYDKHGRGAADNLFNKIIIENKLGSLDIQEISQEVYARTSRGAAQKYGQNPVPLSIAAQKKQAMLLYHNFTGHEPGEEVMIDKPLLPDVMSVIGDVDGILYTTVRDGKCEKYIHKFKKNSRPLFCVSPDGLSIHVIGGSYEFGERGIIDK